MKELHPGLILADLYLHPRKMSASKLAARLDVSHSTVIEITFGRRGISAEMALRLAQFFETTPEYWLELQMRYELMIARRKLGMESSTEFDTNEELEKELAEEIDWKEQMRQSKWIGEEDLEEVCRVYEAVGKEPIDFDKIVQALEMMAGAVSAHLISLELDGWIERRPGEWYVRIK